MDAIDKAALEALRRELMTFSTANIHRLSEYCEVPFGTIDKFRRGSSKDPRYGNVMPLVRSLKKRRQWAK